MKPCMMSGSFLQVPGTTIKDMFEFSKELGIEGIDFCNTNILPVQPKELKKMCDDFGIKAVCNTVLNDVNTPGMTKEKWLDNIKKIVEDALILQTGKIMLPTPGKSGIDKEITRQKWLDNLGEATKIGEDAGVHVSIESYAADAIWSPFISSDDILLAGEIPIPTLKNLKVAKTGISNKFVANFLMIDKKNNRLKDENKIILE